MSNTVKISVCLFLVMFVIGTEARRFQLVNQSLKGDGYCGEYCEGWASCYAAVHCYYCDGNCIEPKCGNACSADQQCLDMRLNCNYCNMGYCNASPPDIIKKN